MTIPVEFVTLFVSGVLVAMGALVGYIMNAIAKIFKALTDIRDHLGKLNGRVGKAEGWQPMHEKQDDERHEQIEREHARMWAAISRMDEHRRA